MLTKLGKIMTHYNKYKFTLHKSEKHFRVDWIAPFRIFRCRRRPIYSSQYCLRFGNEWIIIINENVSILSICDSIDICIENLSFKFNGICRLNLWITILGGFVWPNKKLDGNSVNEYQIFGELLYASYFSEFEGLLLKQQK